MTATQPQAEATPNNINAFIKDYAESVDQGTAGQFLGFTDSNYYEIEMVAHNFYTQKRYSKAITILEGLFSLDRQRHYPLLLMGEVQMAKNNLDEALNYLQEALEVEPTDATTLLKLGELHIKAERPEEGKKVLTQLVEMKDLSGRARVKQQRAEVILHTLQKH